MIPNTGGEIKADLKKEKKKKQTKNLIVNDGF